MRALIADDETHLRDYLEQQLALAWPALRIVARAANGLEALRLCDEEAPDIAFLDIRMPGMSGLDVAARLVEGDRAPHIVFVTAYDQYAVQAFEHAAVDYVLKPVTQERLGKTVARLQAVLSSRAGNHGSDAASAAVNDAAASAALNAAPTPAITSAITPAVLQTLLAQLGAAATTRPAAVGAAPSAQAGSAPLQWIRASQGDQTRLIAVDEVIYFESNDKYTSVMLADGECLIRTPISKLREQLDAQQFWQIHRSVIVAARHVAGTRHDFRGRLMVQLKGRSEQLVVSRNYVDLFRQM